MIAFHTRFTLVAVFALLLSSAPHMAHAALYAPGETLDPACAPTDLNCGITLQIASSTAGSIPYYAADGRILSATSTVTILQNGNVGLRTTSPEYALDINGTLNIQNSPVNTFRMTQDDTHRYFEMKNIVGSSNFGAPTQTDLQFHLVNTYGNGYGQRFSYWMNGVEKMVLENNGNLGIGTSTPSEKLAVQGNGLVTGTLTTTNLVVNTLLTAPSTGITFLQNLTNAVSRSVSSKLTDRISVKDFGAVGDGTTNDTTAIQNAINTASSTNRTIFFPAGTYVVSGLQLPNAYCANLEGDGIDVTTIKVGTATSSAILKTNTSAAYGCTIRNLTVNANNLAGHALELQRGKQWVVQDVKLIDSTSTAAVLGDSSGGAVFYEAQVSHLTVEYQSTTFTAGAQPDYGVTFLSGATDSTYHDIVVKNAKTAGLKNGGSNNTIYSLHVYGFPITAPNDFSPAYALEDSGSDNRYVGLYADTVVTAGAYLRGSRTIITGSQFFWLTSTSSTAGIVKLASTASANMIQNSTCHNMNASSTPITYEGSSGALVGFEATGCTASTTPRLGVYGDNQDIRVGFSDLFSWQMQRNNTTGNLNYNVSVGSSTSYNRFTMTAAGSFGIGTSSPRSLLTMSGSVPTFTINDTRDYSPSLGDILASIDFTSDDTTSTTSQLIGNARVRIAAVQENLFGSAQGLAFSTRNTGALTERLRITNTGNIGMGTSTPAFQLSITNVQGATTTLPTTLELYHVTDANSWAVGDVLGQINFTSPDNSTSIGSVPRGRIAVIQENSFGSSQSMAFYTNAASSTQAGERLRITSAGFVGIGTSTPSTRLTVWGSDTASTTGSLLVANSASTTVFQVFNDGHAFLAAALTQNSDRNLKKDIESLEASTTLNAILALDPVSFVWSDTARGKERQFGFIAQDLQKIFPELVSTTSPTKETPEGTLGVNYIGLIAPTIQAIKELALEVRDMAQHIVSRTVTATQTLCVGSTCITEAELKVLLERSGQSGTPAPVPTPEPTEPEETPDTPEVETPEPTPEPSPEPETPAEPEAPAPSDSGSSEPAS